MQGKQAKILSPTQERIIVRHLETTRYPCRDRVMFLLSIKASLRAKEMAALTWAMVTDAEGQVADTLHLQNRASKGKTGGRSIPLHRDLQAALAALQTECGDEAAHHLPVIFSERGRGLSEASVQLWFHRLYKTLELAGCSSHSGRRTFITRAARKVSEVGGSLRDVQQLAGHASLAMTQRYIEGDTGSQAEAHCTDLNMLIQNAYDLSKFRDEQTAKPWHVHGKATSSRADFYPELPKVSKGL